MANRHIKLGLIGYGAMGHMVLESLQRQLQTAEFAILTNGFPVDTLPRGVKKFDAPAQLLTWSPTVVVECAGHGVVASTLPKCLSSGVDVIVASIGALADRAVEEQLLNAARTGGARLIAVSGAIGGLDALRSAHFTGLEAVRYTGRKPPLAWQGTPAQDEFDLKSIATNTLIFDGTAREAAQRFPKNANVTAAVALAGVGFDRTQVQLFADPTAQSNIQRLGWVR